jgi:hypothetical protein
VLCRYRPAGGTGSGFGWQQVKKWFKLRSSRRGSMRQQRHPAGEALQGRMQAYAARFTGRPRSAVEKMEWMAAEAVAGSENKMKWTEGITIGGHCKGMATLQCESGRARWRYSAWELGSSQVCLLACHLGGEG